MNKGIRVVCVLFWLLGLLAVNNDGLFAQRRSGKSQATQEEIQRKNAQLFGEALQAKVKGNSEEALSLFEEALETDQQDGASAFEIAKIYASKRDYVTAIVYAEQARSINPKNKWYQIVAANIYRMLEDYASYTQTYELLVEQYPDNPEFMQELAQAYLYEGKTMEAIKTYDRLEVLIGINEQLSVQKQNLYMSKGDKEAALHEIVKLSEAFPYDTRYLSMLAELYFKEGKDAEGFYVYEKIREIDPNDPFIHINLADYYLKNDKPEQAYEELTAGFRNPKLDVESKINILLTYYQRSEITEETMKQALELTSILTEVHPDKALSHSIRADLLYQEKLYSEAIISLEQVLSIDSSRYNVWEQLLFAEMEVKSFENLSRDATRAIRIFPEQPLPYLLGAFGHYQLKNYDAAIRKLKTGKSFVVGNDALLAQFYATLGDSYNEIKAYEESYEAYDKALKIDPLNSIVLNNYAYYLSLRNINLDKALEMSAKSVELDPENPSNLDTYAWVHFKLGNYSEALQWIEKAIAFEESDNGTILEHYGDILFKLGRVDEAVLQWKKAKELGDTSDFIDKKINDRQWYDG